MIKSMFTDTTLAEVRVTLAKEDAEALKSSKDMYPHDVSPSSFINIGLELEESQ